MLSTLAADVSVRRKASCTSWQLLSQDDRRDLDLHDVVASHEQRGVAEEILGLVLGGLEHERVFGVRHARDGMEKALEHLPIAALDLDL